jgi:hypothetical protein
MGLLCQEADGLGRGSHGLSEAGLPLQLPEQRWARTPVLAFLAQLGQLACAELAERM